MTALLDMFRGDDREFTFTLTEDGGPLDLTGAGIRFTAKRERTDDDTAAVIAKTVGAGITIDADPLSGVCVLAIAATDTSGLGGTIILPFDLQVTRGGTSRTVVTGLLAVRADVSRTAP